MEYFINTIFPFIIVILGVWYFCEKAYFKPIRNKWINEVSGAGYELSEDELIIINKTSYFTGIAREWFPLLCILFLFRALLWEPYKVASGSMTPNMYKGDFTLTNKHSYGLNNPFTGRKLVEFSGPERGDVIVFKYPLNPEVDYIKRVVGLPGERVIYDQKEITVFTTNRNEIHSTVISLGEYYDKFSKINLLKLTESLGDATYKITNNNEASDNESTYFQQNNTNQNEFIVPNDHYFVLGDNRDDSLDGRYWGFVHKDAIKGKAQFLWLSVEFESSEGLLEDKPVDFNFHRVGVIK